MTTSNFSRVNRLPLAALALLLTLLPLTSVRAQSPPAPKPRVYAVIFLASWCANCKELSPKVAAVLPPLIAKGLIPVPLDMSDAASRQKSLATAEKMGLGKLAAAEDGTGFIVLVDAQKKTRLGRVTSNMTEAQIADAFNDALAHSSVPAPSH